MFKNVTFSEWSVIASMAMFFLTLGIFLVVIVRACLMPKPEREQMADLPFDGESRPTGAFHE